MKQRSNRGLGLALLVAGIASAVYGYTQYYNARNSVGVALRRVFDAPSPELTQAVAIIIAGIAVAVVGAVFLLRR